MASPSDSIQLIQARYRARLADTWAIEAGAKILEVGCGQGDMTSVLAERVGADGRVTAVDIGSPDYGAPQTLGEATELLKASPLGARIDFRLSFDVLHPSVDFPERTFDHAVLAHSSWYFESKPLLVATLSQLRKWAETLCFAEWDLQPKSFDQLPHLLAVLIQGQMEAFKTSSHANVRLPLSREALKMAVTEAGWNLISETKVDTNGLQDADWEIAVCLESSLPEARAIEMPRRMIEGLASQIDVLTAIALPRGNRPLSAFSLIAE